MVVPPGGGVAVYLICCGWCLCSSVARPTCDLHWVMPTGRTLTVTLPGLCSAFQVKLLACRVAVLLSVLRLPSWVDFAVQSMLDL